MTMQHSGARSGRPVAAGARRPAGGARWGAGILGLLAAALATAADAASSAAASAPAAAGRSGDLVWQECHLPGLAAAARCGALRRPVDPAQPQGPAFDLQVAVLPALARQKRPDPVFFFAGGPGQSAIGLAATVQRMLGRFGARRDVVLIDQRGTGRSAPLACEGGPGPQAPLAQQLDLGEQLRAWTVCRVGLAARSPLGDLRHVGTSEAVADAEAVRQAMGLGPVNLVGVSYGTRMVLEYLRQHPQAVRRAVADGVAPADMGLPRAMAEDADRALQGWWAACAQAPECQRRHPRLAQDWQALRASLPRTVTVAHPWSGRPETLTLTPAMLDGLARAPLYVPVLAAALPHAVAEARAGRFQPLLGLAQAMGPGGGGALAQGMHFAVLCREDMGPQRMGAAPAASGGLDAAVAWYAEACRGWSAGTPPEGFGHLEPATVPVLLLSGAFDPVTPARHARRVAAQLGPLAQHREIGSAAHGTLGLACVRDLVFRFVDAEGPAGAQAAVAAAQGCGQVALRPPFLLPQGEGAP